MKWIKCSEKMPEDRSGVLLWDADLEEVISGHYSHKTQLFYHHGHLIENEITHWCMPPRPPQQEVKSALEIGMSRYADAMQKLAEGGD
ncbi:DUF551 domain-containing protein [Morganella morganii]|nr:DUF551 domain-containing protein [Morganella morganii]